MKIITVSFAAAVLIIVLGYFLVPEWLRSEFAKDIEPCSLKSLEKDIGFEVPTSISDFNCNQYEYLLGGSVTWEFTASRTDLQIIVPQLRCLPFDDQRQKGMDTMLSEASDSVLLTCRHLQSSFKVWKLKEDRFRIVVEHSYDD